MDLRVEGIHIFALSLTEEEKSQITTKYVPQPMEQDEEEEEGDTHSYPNIIDTQKLEIISKLHLLYEECHNIFIQYSKELENMQNSIN